MKASITAALLASCSFAVNTVCAQTTRAFNQNASRSNHTRLMTTSDGWTLAASGGTSFATNSNEKSSFRGSGLAGKISANYYFDKIGIGITSGLLTGSINDNALNSFITERKFQANQIQVSKSNPYNSYFLAGPTIHFGNLVSIIADVKGGLFVNNPGSVNINQTGVTRPLYRFEGGEKNLSAGFSGSISIAYPINSSTQFFINTDYLQSRSSVRLLDPTAGIDVPTQMNRDMKLMTAGIGIIKTFAGNRGASSAKKHIGNVKYEDIAARDASSGRPTGRRSYQPVNDQLTNGDQNLGNQSCGPVTQRTTNSDGTTSEMTFACPDDAATYNHRLSMNVTTPKQTQGSTFGEKVAGGLQAGASALSQGASRNTISGTLTWLNQDHIATNKSGSSVKNLAGSGSGAAAASYARQTNQSSFGTMVRLSAREAGSGMASGKREKGSGIATGRRQYEPMFNDNSGSVCNSCIAAITSNPLYQGSGMSGNNPLHKDRLMAGGNGVPSIAIDLIDLNSGAIIAQTTTEDDGSFFFTNVPDGNYGVKVVGAVIVKKGYDITTSAPVDLLGSITLATAPIELNINISGSDTAQNMTQSGRKMIPVTVPDITGAQRPGNPIGGIIVKGGKNPGGAFLTTQTNENGEFEFSNLEAGNYTVSLEQEMQIDDETIVTVSNKVQDHNSSRSNKSASRINTDNDPTGKTNVPVKWAAPEVLKSISVEADLDGDGKYETDVTTKINDEIIVNEKGEIAAPQQKAGVSTSRSNIRSHYNLQSVSDKLYVGYGTAEINGKTVPVKIVYKGGGLKDTLKTQV